MFYQVVQHEKGDGETFNIPALWWLWERRLFYRVFDLSVFVKFRYFTIQKMSLRQHFKSSENFNFDLCIQNNVVQISLHKLPISTLGGCCCRVDNLQHSKSLVISPLWVRASIGSYVRKNSSSACGWSGVFSRGFPIFTPPYD